MRSDIIARVTMTEGGHYPHGDKYVLMKGSGRLYLAVFKDGHISYLEPEFVESLLGGYIPNRKVTLLNSKNNKTIEALNAQA